MNPPSTTSEPGLSIPALGSGALSEDAALHRQVVRLTTSYWRDKRGHYMRRSLITLRRQSSGNQLLDDESDAVGSDEAVANIKNLQSCKDGVYVVEICNVSHDWETGHIDGYDLELVPFADTTGKPPNVPGVGA